ncbi:ExeM/NucH family extracellular endonuclease [Deinococcus arenicola]|uniref:ExeM/NucH family extracellular endonuclease n=1 Tax=Deinococcus arenicola TaxID=2994950 RepID=A0ABU4DQU4_9DEIO|nr:ExeM/NucH family extracellular endonuclease [Deinococcus sp. ZS9-10]MDV6374444.1 ExeM/NucH family extracellular endonuclease [Deinococcus sp. ZS9-10]
MTVKFLRGSVLLLGLTALLSACNPPEVTNPPVDPPVDPPAPTYTCPVGATITPISGVQGSGAASLLVDKTVTVRGVVTREAQVGLGGFFVQDVTPDTDLKTSEGLFVFTADKPKAVKVGEVVEISGTVKEFFGATQLDSVTTVNSCGTTTLPTPSTLTYPLASADALESVEGMLVKVTTPMTVTNTFTLGRYGELGLSSGGRLFNPTNGNEAGGTVAKNMLRTLVLDDNDSKQNPASIPYLNADKTRRAGDTVTGLEGVMHYANNAFKLEPTKAPVFANSNPRTAGPKPVGGTLKVASANVLNYFTTLGSAGRGASNAEEFKRQKDKIVAELRALDADVITLMEIENNGETAMNDLVGALNAAEGKTVYASVKTGTVGTDAIRVAIIYRPDRVETVGGAQIDDNPAFNNARKPIAQTFRDLTGKGVFTVVANHFKSKGCGVAAGDELDKGQGCWNASRIGQAKALLAFADKLKVTDPDVLLMGDLNSYGEEDPIKALEAGNFESLNKRIPLEDRYSYQFDGLFGYLDHALASDGLKGQVTGITEWHVNSDEPVFLDYNTEFKTPEQIRDLYAPTPYRSSDHDPVVVGLNLKADSGTVVPVTVNATGPDTATVGQVYTITVTAGGITPTVGANRSPDSLTADWGDGGPVEGLFPVALVGTHIHTYKTPGTYTVKVTATRNSDKATAMTQFKVTVQAPANPNADKLVISQVYGGGGNGGATFKNDFVELFNAGKVAVNTAGKSVQYASSTGSFNYIFPLPSATIQPGGYYLIGMGSGGTDGTALPAQEASGTQNFSGSNGKVALANNTDPVTGKADTDLLDFVGYGSANEAEGSAAPGLGNATAALRAAKGCTDTNDNGKDFTAEAPAPRNSASAKNVCP